MCVIRNAHIAADNWWITEETLHNHQDRNYQAYLPLWGFSFVNHSSHEQDTFLKGHNGLSFNSYI